MPDHVPIQTWRLEVRCIGRQIDVYDSLDSTNTHALSQAGEFANDGRVIVARAQTAGRGQYGRTWSAPADNSVLMSVLVFPPTELRRPVVLTAWAAVSVCEVIAHVLHKPANIKWPNDVLVGGKKLCGILIEQRICGNLATVVGIGLNVNQSREWFDQAGLPDAASLACFTSDAPDCADVARRLIRQLDAEYDRLLAGDLATLEARWKCHLGLLGKQVVVEPHGEEPCRGRVRDVTFAGVEIAPPAGETIALPPERIKHIKPA